MNKTHLTIGIIMLAAGLLGGFALARGDGRDADRGRSPQQGPGARHAVTAESCVAEECLAVEGFEYPAGELSQPVRDALAAALADEYKARATYEAIIGKFGAVRPFSMIIRAEEMHISSLKALFDKYGIIAPADATGAISAPDSLAQACAAGVAAEIANAKLYETQLIPAAAAYPDIVTVFTNLKEASLLRHLPAFERCSA